MALPGLKAVTACLETKHGRKQVNGRARKRGIGRVFPARPFLIPAFERQILLPDGLFRAINGRIKIEHIEPSPCNL
jgi:hypothetical protein